MKSPKKITIDHRERVSVLRDRLEHLGFQISDDQLKLGDYLLYPDTVIERKTTHDFCVSIVDGRLFDQAFRLAEYSDHSLMIVEGKSFTNTAARLPLAAVRGALVTLAQTYRLPVLRTLDEADTAWHINHLAEQRERIGTNRGVLRGRKPKRLKYQKQNILTALPGVGRKTAEALLEQFGSVQNVMTATYDQLMEIDGIGPKTVARIHNAIHEDIPVWLAEDCPH